MLTKKKFSVVLAAGALALAGCAPVTAPPVPVSPRDAALDVLRDLDPAFDTVPDMVIFDVSEGICAAFDKGYSFAEVVLIATGSGLSGEQAGLLVGFAVNVDCPEWAEVAG